MAESKKYIVEGNTVRVQNRPEYSPKQEIRVHVRPETVPARVRVNVPYVLMLLAVTLLFGYLCFSYLKVQASINASMNRIANLEEQITKVRSENAVRENRLSAQMDLEEVYRIAVDQLGMTYPQDNEVVTYSEQMREYVRQYEDIPNS